MCTSQKHQVVEHDEVGAEVLQRREFWTRADTRITERPVDGADHAVSCRTGVQGREEVVRLPAITIETPHRGRARADLDPDLLDLGGTSGDPNAAGPIQYDELRVEHDQGVTEIVVYSRAILLFLTDSEVLKPFIILLSA